MEAQESTTPRELRLVAEFRLRLAGQTKLGRCVLSFEDARVISVGSTTAVVSPNDSRLLRELIETNLASLLIGDGVPQQLPWEGSVSTEAWPKRTLTYDAPRQSVQRQEAWRSSPGTFDARLPILERIAAAGPPHVERNLRVRMSSRIRRAIDFIEAHADKSVSLLEASQVACLSQSYFCRLFKKELGTTFSRYLASIRVDKAVQLLADTDLTVTEVCYRVGFNDLTHFGRVFKGRTGLTPTRFRAENASNLHPPTPARNPLRTRAKHRLR